MKKVVLLIASILVISVFTGIICCAAVPDSSYQMMLSDEFNGTELDTSIWKHRLGDTYGGRNLAQNVRISDGKLYLDYTKTNGIYSGAGIITNKYLPYGYYETKAKVFTGVNGFHTSFWTAGGILEIDCFEVDSKQGTSAPPPYYNLHYWWADHSMVGGKSFYNNAAGNAFTSDWFVAGFEWLPGKVIFYSNGKAVGSVSPDVYSPSDLWLTAVAVPDWHKNSDGTYNIDDSKMDANGYFGSSEYEYFHYYNKKLKGVNLLGNGHFELNRNKTSDDISSFDTVKSTISLKTPYAHNGYCVAYLSNTAELGQYVNYIAEGKYTFEGYFKTKDSASATIAVYDKDGNLLKSAVIPTCNDWTLVSLKDVAVTGSAYCVVKSTSGIVWADDLSFFCQEGDATYEGYEEGDYKKYNAIPNNSDYPVLNSALIAQLDSVVYQYKNNPYAFSKTDSMLVPYKEGNEIYVPYQAIKASFPISGVDSNATYVSLSQINASGTYAAHTNGHCIIICSASEKIYSSTIIAAQLSLNCFRDPSSRIKSTATYKGTSDIAGQIIYDTESASLTGSWSSSSLGYASNGKYSGSAQCSAEWSPKILTPGKYSVQIYSNSHTGGTSGAAPTTKNAGVDLTIGNKAYTYSLNQYNGSSGWYDLGSFEISSQDFMTIKLYNASGEGLLRASAIRIIPQYSFDTASYVGTADENNQVVFDINSCLLSGAWGNSGLGYTGGSRYSEDSRATAAWTVAPSLAGEYSIQIYSVVHAGDTSINAPASTTEAGVLLKVSDEEHHYRLNQCSGDMGWYDLGTFTFKAGQTADITLHHIADDGHLRANAVRLVPNVISVAEYVGTSVAANQTVYNIETCNLAGSWGTSGLGYAGGSRFSSDSSSTATWTVSPSAKGNYSVQVYSIAHAGDTASGAPASTTAAGVRLDVSGETYKYLLNQCTGSTGWYDLGTFPFEAGESATITMYHTLCDGHLRANAVRIVPEASESYSAFYVGTATEANQELHTFSSATKTGTWLGSGGALTGCYYGDGKAATVTWNVAPKYSKYYSVQVYMPCINNGNTTQSADVALTVGSATYNYNINQRTDTSTNMGWYDLGIFNLKPGSPISVKISMESGQFLRAKDLRLVPVPESIPASVSSGKVTITPGFISNHIEKILFAEYNNSGAFQSLQILDPSSTVEITMKDALNKFKIFYWKSLSSMKPLVKQTQN